MRGKLGLSTNEEGDLEIAQALLQAMHENAADFTLTFRRLCDVAADEKADAHVRNLFANPVAYDNWLRGGDRVWPLRGSNPADARRR
jgi:uncharacterized protein YdiU (UPF0061 family)